MVMKTYLFETLNRYKRFSESLDAKAVLSNKAWIVFNDEGEKQVYIFQEDGTVLITTNGIGSVKTWKYIPANKSILIKGEGNRFVMLRTAFVDENILAFQLDGTDRYAFMIDENNKALFAPKTLEELNVYLVDKLDKEKQILIEQQNKENEFAEKAKQEADREKAEKIRREIEMKYLDPKMKRGMFFVVLAGVFYILTIALLPELGGPVWVGSLLFAIIFTYLWVYSYKQGMNTFKQKIKEYKDNNSNDPCIAYL
jgi:hypothetical protein